MHDSYRMMTLHYVNHLLLLHSHNMDDYATHTCIQSYVDYSLSPSHTVIRQLTAHHDCGFKLTLTCFFAMIATSMTARHRSSALQHARF